MQDKLDIVVIGAGPAGICAAINGARLGKKVALVGNRPVIGGNSSSEIRVWTRGSTGGGNIYAEEMGIWGQIKLQNLNNNPEANPVIWDDVMLDFVKREKNLTLFLNTDIKEIKIEKGLIKKVSGYQQMSEKFIELEATYFIDCTGDGLIGALADVPFNMGQESRETYEEDLAPLNSNTNTFGNTIFFYTKEVDEPVKYLPPDFVLSIPQIDQMLGAGGRIVNETMNGCDYWWFETGGTQNTISDADNIAFKLKQLVLGVWNYIKNSKKFCADNLTLEWIGNVPGKRESRRMITEKVLTQKDVISPKKMEDGAFYGGWYLDFHPSDGINTDEEFCTQIPVHIYPIPFGTLYNQKCKNLLFAGRDIGTSHVAFASSRIMNTCALSGQAASTLCNVLINSSKYTNEITDDIIKESQNILIKNDVLIPFINQRDDNDLAQKAKINASAIIDREIKQNDNTIVINEDFFVVIPPTKEFIYILMYASEETEINYTCHPVNLPSRKIESTECARYKLIIPEGTNWINIKKPEVEMFCKLNFINNDKVKICLSDEQLTGFVCGNKQNSKLYYPCIKLDNYNDLYSAENIINGYNRPWGRPNCWISSEKMPYIKFEWDTKQQISEICCYFNCDLSKELTSSHASTWNEHHDFEGNLKIAKELIKDFDVYYKDDEWVKLTEIRNNIQRFVTVKFDKINTQAIKLVFVSTHGSECFEVFEVRIYN